MIQGAASGGHNPEKWNITLSSRRMTPAPRLSTTMEDLRKKYRSRREYSIAPLKYDDSSEDEERYAGSMTQRHHRGHRSRNKHGEHRGHASGRSPPRRSGGGCRSVPAFRNHRSGGDHHHCHHVSSCESSSQSFECCRRCRETPDTRRPTSCQRRYVSSDEETVSSYSKRRIHVLTANNKSGGSPREYRGNYHYQHRGNEGAPRSRMQSPPSRRHVSSRPGTSSLVCGDIDGNNNNSFTNGNLMVLPNRTVVPNFGRSSNVYPERLVYATSTTNKTPQQQCTTRTTTYNMSMIPTSLDNNENEHLRPSNHQFPQSVMVGGGGTLSPTTSNKPNPLFNDIMNEPSMFPAPPRVSAAIHSHRKFIITRKPGGCLACCNNNCCCNGAFDDDARCCGFWNVAGCCDRNKKVLRRIGSLDTADQLRRPNFQTCPFRPAGSCCNI